jgi:cobalt/nickel transport system permease protein
MPLLFMGLIALILWFISQIPFRHLLQRLAIAIPFVSLMALGMILGHEATWEMGIDRLLHIILRAALAITFVTILASTTPFPRFLEGLKWLGIPKVIHSLLSFIYRFIYIIIDEFQRASRGMQSRELRKNLVLAWKSRSWMIGSFLVRSIERSERVYGAMLARGYGEEKK